MLDLSIQGLKKLIEAPGIMQDTQIKGDKYEIIIEKKDGQYVFRYVIKEGSPDGRIYWVEAESQDVDDLIAWISQEGYFDHFIIVSGEIGGNPDTVKAEDFEFYDE